MSERCFLYDIVYSRRQHEAEVVWVARGEEEVFRKVVVVGGKRSLRGWCGSRGILGQSESTSLGSGRCSGPVDLCFSAVHAAVAPSNEGRRLVVTLFAMSSSA